MDFNKLMAEAQKLQRDMEQQENELKNKEYHSQVRKDLVEVTMNGDYEVLQIKINEDFVSEFTSEDAEILEDAIMLAVNDTLTQIQNDKNNMLGNLAGSIDIPGLR